MARAIANCASCLWSFWLSSRTLACLTVFVSCEAYFFSATTSWLFKAHSHVLLHISPFNHPFALSCRSLWIGRCLWHIEKLLKLFKDLLKTSRLLCLWSTTTFPKSWKSEAKRIETKAFSLLVCILLIITRHAGCIVNPTLLIISQSLIGLIYFWKLLWSICSLIDIRMVLFCFHKERSFDLFVTRCWSNSQCFYTTKD